MGAAYTIADYMGLFLVYTLGSVLVVGAFCVFLIRKLAKKNSFGLYLLRSLAILFSCIC